MNINDDFVLVFYPMRFADPKCPNFHSLFHDFTAFLTKSCGFYPNIIDPYHKLWYNTCNFNFSSFFISPPWLIDSDQTRTRKVTTQSSVRRIWRPIHHHFWSMKIQTIKFLKKKIILGFFTCTIGDFKRGFNGSGKTWSSVEFKTGFSVLFYGLMVCTGDYTNFFLNQHLWRNQSQTIFSGIYKMRQ